MKLAIGVLLMTLMSSTFTVEKLSVPELNELNAARTKLNIAANELAVIEKKIKEAHGQSKPSTTINASCIAGGTTVELRGDYALITSESHYICGAVAE